MASLKAPPPNKAVRPTQDPAANAHAVRSAAADAQDTLALGATAAEAESDADDTFLSVSGPEALSNPGVTPNGAGVSPDARGLSAAVVTAPKQGTQRGLIAGVYRASLSGSMTRAVGNRQGSLSVSVMDGFASVGADNTWTLKDGGTQRNGAWLGGWKDEAYAGGQVTRTSAAGITTFLGGYLGGGASRVLEDLGAYAGDVPGLVGKRSVQLTRAASSFGGANAGWGAAFGIGGLLSLAKSSTVVFKTHLDNAEARTLLYAERGLARAVSDRTKAVGWEDEPVNVPDLSRPETLHTGDEILLTTEGQTSMGVVVGMSGLTVGAVVSVRGTFEVAARRLDATHVEVAVTPTDIRGVQVNAGLPVLADMRWSTTRAQALRQAFVFDVSNASGLHAYQEALKGQLPSAMPATSSDLPADEALHALVTQEKLPQGVRRTYLARVTADRSRMGLGINWGPVQSGKWAGLSWHHVSEKDETHVVIPEGVAVVSNRSVEKRREVLLSGAETAGVFGSLRQVTLFDDDGPHPQFDGLTLAARFSDSRVRGMELNSDILEPLNQALGIQIPPFKREGRHQCVRVNATVELDAAALQRLAARENTGALSEKDRAALEPLFERLSQTRDPIQQAEAVQAHVARHGVTGLGALVRLMGLTPRVEVQSSAYQGALQRAEQLLLEYPGPAAEDEAPDTLVARMMALGETADALRAGVADLEEDPLVSPAERPALHTAMDSAASALAQRMELGHLSAARRLDLRAQLNQGWVSSSDSAVMAMLANAGATAAAAREAWA